jgi:hypothetical protein
MGADTYEPGGIGFADQAFAFHLIKHGSGATVASSQAALQNVFRCSLASGDYILGCQISRRSSANAGSSGSAAISVGLPRIVAGIPGR